MKVLDIGFGTGFPLTELAMRLGEDSVIYGIDPWKQAIERVRRKVELYGITNIHIIEGLAENIPVEDLSIDLITSNNGINNVNDIARVISECGRIMKPGGQFVQTMNLDKSMIEFYEVFEGVLAQMKMSDEIQKMHKHIIKKRPSVDSLISIIEESGFRIREVQHDLFFYQFASGTAMFNHYFIRLAFMGPWMEIIPAGQQQSVFEKIELKLNYIARENGHIKLSIPFVVIDAVKNS
jgi:ubiquinone/menaquinone biosynthesis C-methylase UbiE